MNTVLEGPPYTSDQTNCRKKKELTEGLHLVLQA